MQDETRLTRIWAKDDPFGAELAEISLEAGTLSATGVTIGSDPLPYRLEYDLTTSDGYITSRLRVTSRGTGWRRDLVLERDRGSGRWSCTAESAGEVDLAAPGGDLSGLSDALDCDLGLSPLTNSMPVLRHGLHLPNASKTVDFVMAWVEVPSLSVTPSPQRYTTVRNGVVRYEGLDTDFTAELTFDEHGIVVDYPGLARAVASLPAQRQNPTS